MKCPPVGRGGYFRETDKKDQQKQNADTYRLTSHEGRRYDCSMARQADIERQLRQAIENGPLSRYEIAKRSGVSQAQLSRFVNGSRTLTLTSAAQVAKVLGLHLVQKGD